MTAKRPTNQQKSLPKKKNTSTKKRALHTPACTLTRGNKTANGKEPHMSAKDLHMPKKRALHTPTRTRTRGLKTADGKEPYTSANEPYTLTTEPCTFANEQQKAYAHLLIF